MNIILGFLLLALGLPLCFWFITNQRRPVFNRRLAFNYPFFVICGNVVWVGLVVAGIVLVFSFSSAIGLFTLTVLVAALVSFRRVQNNRIAKGLIRTYRKVRSQFPDEYEYKVLCKVFKVRHPTWDEDLIKGVVRGSHNIDDLINLVIYNETGKVLVKKWTTENSPRQAKFMKMKPIDVMGSLYSKGGLRFGGFQTQQFLEVTEDIEELRPGVREEIVAEADSLIRWQHRFPEIAFLLGTVMTGSLLIGFLSFLGAYLIEILRFYTFGASPVLSRLCGLWGWVKWPLFLGAAILLWQQARMVSIVLITFLILQGLFMLVSVIGMFPIRAIIATLLFRAFRKKHPHIHNMEGLAMQFVIDRWRMKLLPPEEALKFYHVDNKEIDFYNL